MTVHRPLSAAAQAPVRGKEQTVNGLPKQTDKTPVIWTGLRFLVTCVKSGSLGRGCMKESACRSTSSHEKCSVQAETVRLRMLWSARTDGPGTCGACRACQIPRGRGHGAVVMMSVADSRVEWRNIFGSGRARLEAGRPLVSIPHVGSTVVTHAGFMLLSCGLGLGRPTSKSSAHGSF